MTVSRLVPVLALTFASLAAPVLAGSYQGGPPTNHPGLPLDAELLPPNAAPGQCFSRRVTGPGGAYRWDRIECDNGGVRHDPWGPGQPPLDIETRGPPLAGSYDTRAQGGYAYGGGYAGDRYGERRSDVRYERSQEDYEYEQYRAYGDGYGQGRGGPAVSYPPPYASYGYVAAGRDEAGYLIWPGKTP